MIFKSILIVALLFVVISLFSAFYFLIKDPSSSTRTAKTLLVRVTLSLCIMLLLFVGVQLGWVEPHALGK